MEEQYIFNIQTTQTLQTAHLPIIEHVMLYLKNNINSEYF